MTDIQILKKQPPQIVRELVERYEEQHTEYHSGKYNETQLRRDFLDPFFEALGWDVSNKKNYSERFREVHHEVSVEVEGQAKLADYAFQSGGGVLFFVEAKKPAVNIESDLDASFQIRRYAWSAKLPVSILTNFEQFSIYDCRSKPVHGDPVHVGRTHLFSSNEFLNRWDELWNLISFQAVHQGSLDKLIQSSIGRKGTADVDDDFLAEMERWRKELALNIALRNPSLTTRQINTSVQLTIDRIIFLRICEDRKIEPEENLRNATDGIDVYGDMMALFTKADKKYNSGLFHFSTEKGRLGYTDTLTPNIKVDDRIIKDILANLYLPKSPYAFNYFSADVLGHVYERFLGKVIRLTPGHQAKVEEKPEVRKAGGVYYTPTYIVNYIVENTVGELLKDKTPEGLNSTPLRVLDPACGSGSFLIGAYQYLLDWYLDWYVNNDPAKWAKGSHPAIFENFGNWKLTLEQRKLILTRHIYGVDIDPQAVEVTKLSLLLKVVEAPGQVSFLGERILPDLDNNIKCGNSLIGSTFYDGQQMDMFKSEKQYRVNAFDWQESFSQVFKDSGFDVVIGNPPYVRIQVMKEWAPDEGLFFHKTYRSAESGNYDLYGLFIEKALELINKEGLISFIIGSKWLSANYAENLRKIIGPYLQEIIDFKYNQVFENAFVNTIVIKISKDNSNKFDYFQFPKSLSLERTLHNIIQQGNSSDVKKYTIDPKSLTSSPWYFANPDCTKLLSRLKNSNPDLESICNRIYQGLKTSADNIFLVNVKSTNGDISTVFSKQLNYDIEMENELLKPLFRGSQVKKYHFVEENRAIIFPYADSKLISEKTLKTSFPLIYHYFLLNRKVLEEREHGIHKGKNWYGFGRSQAIEIMQTPKILTPDLARYASFSYDQAGSVFFVGGAAGGYGIILKPEQNYFYVLGLLNSKLIDYVIKAHTTQMESGFFSYEARFIRTTPIHLIDSKNPKEVSKYIEIENNVKSIISLCNSINSDCLQDEKEYFQRQINATDRKIDNLVYELYGLTDEEIRIVEEG